MIGAKSSRYTIHGHARHKGERMIAVIFELEPAEGRKDDYFRWASQLKAQLERMDGFLSIERFESVSQPGKFVSLSFWRDEQAVTAWRNLDGHRAAQAAGRAGIFKDYRLRVAQVLRDYGMTNRAEAPADSRIAHA
jgi:heme-degrading monooxygenase HmoA